VDHKKEGKRGKPNDGTTEKDEHIVRSVSLMKDRSKKKERRILDRAHRVFQINAIQRKTKGTFRSNPNRRGSPQTASTKTKDEMNIFRKRLARKEVS